MKLAKAPRAIEGALPQRPALSVFLPLGLTSLRKHDNPPLNEVKVTEPREAEAIQPAHELPGYPHVMGVKLWLAAATTSQV